MFILLREGHEPFAVNPRQVCALEALASGRETAVLLANGGTIRLMVPFKDCLAKLEAARESDDWIDEPKPKRRAADR